MKGIFRHFAVHIVTSALCLVVLAAAFIFLRPQLGARTSAGKTPVAESERAIVELDEFVVNLADPDRAHYAKATLALEVSDAKTAEHIQKKALPRVRDAIIMTLCKQYFRTLNTSDGKLALKRQLADAVNQAIPQGGGKVTDVLFTSLVMQ
jgi:flagellar basal body-associated protein FliL